MHKKVAVIGAGPAGILLTRMLRNRDIDVILFENRNEKYLRRLDRGGYLNQSTFDLLTKESNGEILAQKAIPIKSKIVIEQEEKAIPIFENNEEGAWILDQGFIINTLLDELKEEECPILWEAKAQRYEGIESDKVKIIYTQDGQLHDLTCDYVIGCDGYRGISRRSIPQPLRNEHLEELPLAWVEWRTDAKLSNPTPKMGMHEDGFAMMIGDCKHGTRYYLEIKRGTEVDDLPSEEELWEMVETRLDIKIERQAMQGKIIDYMRLFYSEMMQHGRLFIAGDAAHQVPRLGSGGLNMAFQDASRMAIALEQHYNNNNSEYLSNYTQDSLDENISLIHQINEMNKKYHQK